MMKKLTTTFWALALAALSCHAQADLNERAMWGSINGASNASLNNYTQHTGKALITWRMLPGDDENTAFDIYRKVGNLRERKLNTKAIIGKTNYQDTSPSKSADNIYRLTYHDSDETLATYTLPATQVAQGLPYISIPLKDTKDVCDIDSVVYQANDISVGDLDGDGQMEIIVKRLQTSLRADGTIRDEFGVGASYSNPATIYAVIWDAYKLDGTFLWRVKGGPGIILGNSSAFAVADFDGDGCCEMVIRTCEGTVFGDGEEIGDTDGDGIIDHRTWGNLGTSHEGYIDHYNSAGPEFISVIDGKTGRELARDNFINRDTSGSWGDEYWKRACSFRVGVAWFSGEYPSIFLGRGVYNRSVLEAWDYRDGQLTKRWRFDSADTKNNANKDGRPNSQYGGQGNHSFNVADVDGDGKDEVMYGSMVMDDDGHGLWTSRLGHGDANHVGKFLPDSEGLQVYHCLESGVTMVALHDAATGKIIWDKKASSSNDTGRAMVADIDPNSPGCEFWWAGSNAYSQDGATDLGYKPSSCNAAIWFDGTLNRQLINENIIQNERNGGRAFTIYRYDESFINGSKSNPNWYGDLLGDWREEFIVSDQTRLKDIKIFSTWYPTDYKFYWLMTDHTYYMGVLNENVGYNQPPNLGYYLGTETKNDIQAAWQYDEKTWVELSKNNPNAVGISSLTADGDKASRMNDGHYYNLQGQRLATPPAQGIYIYNGKKYFNR